MTRGRLYATERVEIEQAIARGRSNKWVMDAYGISYRQLAELKIGMLGIPDAVGHCAPSQPCGTHAGYNRHRARHEDACVDCRRAETEHRAARHARDKARKAAA